jgi:uroporphyrinogen decarboxylase
MSNDDWGFKSQTFLSPAHMREYVLPWHKKIVAAAHARNLPAVLHSCGNLDEVMDDVIDYCAFDAKHSYEDAILPVEDCYEKWGARIAILGGVDVDFVINRTEAEIADRSRAMLRRAGERGGYALGTGNSVPEYVPQEKYLAMIGAALNF